MSQTFWPEQGARLTCEDFPLFWFDLYGKFDCCFSYHVHMRGPKNLEDTGPASL